MIDKEKVIKALELEIKHDGTWDCIGECPYYGHTDYNCYTQVAMDAVELLKESCQTEWERDTAFNQLRQIGKSCGEKMDDIAWVLQRPGHGRWERLTGMAPPEYHGHKVCSVCGCLAPYNPLHPGHEELSEYCPGCGARMDGGRDEQ